jgi:hypothetical protein
MNSVPEIRREKVFIPPEMTVQEIKEKYGLSSKRAREAMKQGFFVRNYSKKQIIIDPDNFDPAISVFMVPLEFISPSWPMTAMRRMPPDAVTPQESTTRGFRWRSP